MLLTAILFNRMVTALAEHLWKFGNTGYGGAIGFNMLVAIVLYLSGA